MMTTSRNLRKLFWRRRNVPIAMVGLILVIGFFTGTYNPFSNSLIALTIPEESNHQPLIHGHQAIGTNRSSTDDSLVDDSNGDGDIAMFHNFPLVYIKRSPPLSTVHCVGESFADSATATVKHPIASTVNSTKGNNTVDNSTISNSAFMYRSCAFRNLCFDVHSRKFILISSNTSSNAANPVAQTILPRYRDVYESTSWKNNSVSLGPIAKVWSDEDRKLFEWFPQITSQRDLHENGFNTQGYYQLDPSVILVPFAFHGASNPGHVLWDNFLPIYKLVTMFDLCWNKQHNNSVRNQNNPNRTFTTTKTPLLMYMPLPKYVFGACTRNHHTMCVNMVNKLLPLLGLTSTNHLVGTKDVRLMNDDRSHPRSATLVCANAGAAGLGMLSDHATKEHGQYNQDYDFAHNVGKSELVFQYRNFILNNMGLTNRIKLGQNQPPYRITVSTNSSQDPRRLLDFEPQIQAMQEAFPPSTNQVVTVETYIMRQLSLKEQLRIASESFFYLSACGGSVMTATFLPRGASLILFYPNNRFRRLPSYLDFDLLNNLSYIRVHWISKQTMNDKDTLALLILLIQHELGFLMTAS